MTTNICFACQEDGDDLQPLYADRAADAQPIAWAHKKCLATPTAEEVAQEAEDMRKAFENLNLLRKRRPTRVPGGVGDPHLDE